MALSNSIFFEKYNITTHDLEAYLSEALSRGGDYADLYFEHRINHSIVLEEQIIKSIVGANWMALDGDSSELSSYEDSQHDRGGRSAREAL